MLLNTSSASPEQLLASNPVSVSAPLKPTISCHRVGGRQAIIDAAWIALGALDGDKARNKMY
jgi:hypothetical protein